MAIICPTVTAYDTLSFKEQTERVRFAGRIHFDFMDGRFAPTISPSVDDAGWPADVTADLHIMYERPAEHLAYIVSKKPNLVVLHAEADGNFIEMAKKLRDADIKVGIALLQKSSPEVVRSVLEYIDHVLIFSGDLGHHGGTADIALLDKVKFIKSLNPLIEIGWDGGITDINAGELVQGGVDVLNVGGFIQKAENPQAAYGRLKAVVTVAISNDTKTQL